MFVLFLSSFLLFLCLLDHFIRLKKYNWLKQFNGSWMTLPLLGDALQLTGHPSTLAEVVRCNFARYGCTWKMWFMNHPYLFTKDVNLVKQLLTSRDHLDKLHIYDYSLKPFAEYGLVTSRGHQWKQDRKILNKMNNYKYLHAIFEMSVQNSNALVKEIGESQTKRLTFYNLLRRNFLLTLFMSLGIDPSWTSKEITSDFAECLRIGAVLVNIRMMKPWTKNSIIWNLMGYQKQFKRCQHLKNKTTKKTIDYLTKKQKLKELSNEMGELECDKETAETRFCLEDILMDPDLSWEWKSDQLLTLATAGTDTSAIAGTMTLFFLATHPHYQRRAQEEVDKLFSSTEVLKSNDMSQLKFLRMCVKEAMRLHPPVPVIGRITSNEIILEDGRKIPKGAEIIISIYDMNLNPKYFPDPLNFDPERFNEENRVGREACSFIPFSTGPRSCIGMKFSENTLPPALAIILKEFNVHTNQKPEDIKLLYEAVGTPFPSVNIFFERRNNH